MNLTPIVDPQSSPDWIVTILAALAAGKALWLLVRDAFSLLRSKRASKTEPPTQNKLYPPK